MKNVLSEVQYKTLIHRLESTFTFLQFTLTLRKLKYSWWHSVERWRCTCPYIWSHSFPVFFLTLNYAKGTTLISISREEYVPNIFYFLENDYLHDKLQFCPIRFAFRSLLTWIDCRSLLGSVYIGNSCPWLEGYPTPRVNFTERLYEETLSRLAGWPSFALQASQLLTDHVKAFPRSCPGQAS